MLRERPSVDYWVPGAAALLVRAAFILGHPLDSDEPQHLHVAWAWSRGLVQYRDVFDNHFPLLHLLFAPLMRLMPESSSVFLLMRCAIAPIAIACSWLVFKIGEPLIGRRAAIIAAITFSVLPPWLPYSVEFRNDILWIFFWLAALACTERPFLRGICAALCLLASVKALPLFLAHALAFASIRQPFAWKRMACGFAIPLAIAVITFQWLGAFDAMLYATLFYNIALPVHAARRIGGAISFGVIAPVLALRVPERFRNAHLVYSALWYPVILLCFWPSLTPRDVLPLVPLVALVGVGQALSLSRQAESLSYTIFILAALASITVAQPWQSAGRTSVVDAAVALTSRDDLIYDLKGETVFRRRPVFGIYDVVGRALTGNGTLPDRAPEQMAARGCCIAIADMSYIPPRTRAFLNAHFIGQGPVRVCGADVRDGAFVIAVPQVYAVVAREPWRVAIDGVRYTAPRFLDAGRHTLTSTEHNVRVVWWRAVRTNR